jgi:hypothetical protein
MFHCGLCNDYDLCAECMRERQAAAGKAGGKWNLLQADESVASRVLGSKRAVGRAGVTKDVLTGERFHTARARRGV